MQCRQYVAESALSHEAKRKKKTLQQLGCKIGTRTSDTHWRHKSKKSENCRLNQGLNVADNYVSPVTKYSAGYFHIMYSSSVNWYIFRVKRLSQGHSESIPTLQALKFPGKISWNYFLTSKRIGFHCGIITFHPSLQRSVNTKKNPA